MFLFHPIHFRKFLVKFQPQRSYKKGASLLKQIALQKDCILYLIMYIIVLKCNVNTAIV